MGHFSYLLKTLVSNLFPGWTAHIPPWHTRILRQMVAYILKSHDPPYKIHHHINIYNIIICIYIYYNIHIYIFIYYYIYIYYIIYIYDIIIYIYTYCKNIIYIYIYTAFLPSKMAVGSTQWSLILSRPAIAARPLARAARAAPEPLVKRHPWHIWRQLLSKKDTLW